MGTRGASAVSTSGVATGGVVIRHSSSTTGLLDTEESHKIGTLKGKPQAEIKEIMKDAEEKAEKASQMTDGPIYDSVDQLLEDTAKLADDASRDPNIRDFVETMAKFWKYSPTNQWLIRWQDPQSTVVASYDDWQRKFHRHVKAGAHGIKVWYPYKKKVITNQQEVDDEEAEPEYRQSLRFGIGNVFDVRDTEGEPLPEIDYKGGGDEDNGLRDDLEIVAKSMGVKSVTYSHDAEDLSPTTYGYHRIHMKNGGYIVFGFGEEFDQENDEQVEREIVVRDKEANGKPVPRADQAITLCHELAHDYLHKMSDRFILPHRVVEIEAEAVATVVAKHYGIEHHGENYMAVKAGVKGMPGMTIKERWERIAKATKFIIGEIEKVKA